MQPIQEAAAKEGDTDLALYSQGAKDWSEQSAPTQHSLVFGRSFAYIFRILRMCREFGHVLDGEKRPFGPCVVRRNENFIS